MKNSTALKDEGQKEKLQALLDNVYEDKEYSYKGFSIVPSDGFDNIEEDKPKEHSKPEIKIPTSAPHEIKVTQEVPFRSNLKSEGQEKVDHKIIASLLNDLKCNFMTYFLMVILCILALIKVCQVQQTRNLIASYNEVRTTNENLERQWLDLTAMVETLTLHSTIRQNAKEDLQMVNPKTEDEQVIILRR